MRRTPLTCLAVILAATVAAQGCAPPPSAGDVPQQEPLVTGPESPPALLAWDDLLGRPRPEPTTAIRWGAGATDVADLWLPSGAGPHAVVLMVHGGCWQKSIADRTLMNYAAEALRAEGLAVWNIEYRGVDESGGGYPGTFLDVARAADALRDAAPAHNLDLGRVAALGHSAGGHLALWLAARPNLPASSPLRVGDPLKMVGVVNTGGLADLKASAPVTQASCLADIMDDLTGAPSDSRKDVFSDTSPAELLPLGARQVSISGDQDRISPPQLAQSYTDRALLAGDAAELTVIANTGHVELVAPGSTAFDVTIDVLKDMLK